MEYLLKATLTTKRVLRLFLLDYEAEIKKFYSKDVIRKNGWSAEIEISENQLLDPQSLMNIIKQVAVNYTDASRKEKDQHLNILRYSTYGNSYCNEVIVGFQVYEKRTLVDNRSTLGLDFENQETISYKNITHPVYIYGVEKTRKQLLWLEEKSALLNTSRHTSKAEGETEEHCKKHGYSFNTCHTIRDLLNDTGKVKKFLQISKTGFVSVRENAQFIPYMEDMIVL